ncbi:putative cargo-transport protein [Lachnellula hyalina]|uniref:Putative cargo-transport protein n=1 Tax=Lachnellula hyalina TaxID=1316788 RepID=A0A8H8TZI7_9HELO|nr:putative cargo-transport protein [Lachnellula hyalina]TVY26395.1 putative cargo-transport protein [Lachnellula hyalina]
MSVSWFPRRKVGIATDPSSLLKREQTKAAHYIQLLDEARCQGNWDAVPELVRKVKKHAPNRTCLTLTVESELAVTEYAHNRPNSSRPGTARPSTANSTQSPSISRYIPLLLEAIENERTYVEDEFQAVVCLGWIHWHLGEPGLAASRLPRNIEQDFSKLDGTKQESAEWTRVCALKASYIKGTSQSRTGAVAEALETYESALPILTSASSVQQGRELRLWTELYLTGFCLLSSLALKSKISSILETETLSAFRAWANFWDTQAPLPTGGKAAQAEVSRRGVWKEYYVTLSDLLQQELPFPTTSLTTAYAETSTRLQQRAELKRVEAKYETLLLNEVQFPKAEEGSEEVEAFVDIVMQNWRILCGNSWSEQDLGEGGAEGVSRGVLDILYRAATKTFHSTAILRHLFTVHLAVAEFELALKAFDTYLEIVKKSKARVEKTGEAEQGLDDDETVLRTASECIQSLCRYGSREGVEKAKELGHYFEEWLDKHHPSKRENGNGKAVENGDSSDLGTVIAPQMFAMAWRCIGIGHAQWARLTFDATTRLEIQSRAIRCFKKALLPEFASSTDVKTLFALGTILAERRELSSAIEVVKIGLIPRRPSTTSHSHGLGPHPGRFARERSSIPLWHLMALLLSARQDFVTAAKSCEGAFEQFQDPKYLFGEDESSNSYRSEHLKEKSTPRNQGIVDEMDDFEKESVLEVKMTQLALIEVLEGPEIAVNASDELLTLYTRLFDAPQKQPALAVVPATPIPPKSSAGTIKSIKGSIFGRSGRSRRKSNALAPTPEEKSSHLRPQTTQTVAPTIQVTRENGASARQRSHSTKDPHHHEKLQKRSESVSRKRSNGSQKSTNAGGRKVNTDSSSRATTVDGEQFFTPSVETQDKEDWFSEEIDSEKVGLAVSPESKSARQAKTLPPKSQQMAHKEPALKPAHPDPAAAQDSRLPHVKPYSTSANPVTRFPKEQERRRRIAILVKVWLLVSGFYRRASMFDDAKGAIEEAQKLVEAMESEVTKVASGNVSIDNAGWGGGKSVGALWGDVFSERGYLAVAELLPYVALHHFESALTHFPDHPSATVGLSNILLDIYTEDLLPPPSIPTLVQPHTFSTPSASTVNTLVPPTAPFTTSVPAKTTSSLPDTQHSPLGLPTAKPALPQIKPDTSSSPGTPTRPSSPKESSAALLDRLAARDRAYGLLSGLTKLGTGWNYSEAWFALARAYEEGGQPDKAREVLWWCVELEEARAVRDWTVVGSGGYVL